ncbi:MAG: tetratricopeptide repeat protein [Chloroflexota bacterium]
MLQQQQLANAAHWLSILAIQNDPTQTIIQEYDNLLRALEVSLEREDRFDLAYRLIEQLFPIVFGYADWDRWLVYLERAIQLGQQVKQTAKGSNLLSYKGNIYTYKGDLAGAQEIYQECLAQYLILDDMDNYVVTLTKIANVTELQGNFSRSIDLLHEAKQISNSTYSNLTIAKIDLSLSSAYIKSREWSLGLTAAESAYNLAKKENHRLIEMQAALNIIFIQTELGHWKEVEILASELEIALNTSGDLVRLSQLKTTQGIAAFHQEHYLEAEKAWQEALQINTIVNQPGELAHLYNNLGMVYTKLNELDTAEIMLNHAAAIFRDNGDIYNWANATDNLADVYELQGKQLLALETLHLALSQLTAHKLHDKELWVMIDNKLRALQEKHLIE